MANMVCIDPIQTRGDSASSGKAASELESFHVFHVLHTTPDSEARSKAIQAFPNLCSAEEQQRDGFGS